MSGEKARIQGEDTNIGINPGGSLRVSTDGLAISRGLIPGQTSIHKFGETVALAKDVETDVWDYSATVPVYNFSASADINSISSNKTADTQTVLVSGLDANWNTVNQTATLSGTSKVSLSTSLIRVYRVKNTGATDFAGQIFCYVTTAITSGVPQQDSYIRAHVNNGNNQTLMAIQPVPANKKAYLKKWSCTLSGKVAGSIDVHLWYRPFGGVFQLKESISIISTGSSSYQYTYDTPLEFDGKGDFKVTAEANTINMICSAGFDLLFVDDDA